MKHIAVAMILALAALGAAPLAAQTRVDAALGVAVPVVPYASAAIVVGAPVPDDYYGGPVVTVVEPPRGYFDRGWRFHRRSYFYRGPYGRAWHGHRGWYRHHRYWGGDDDR